MGSARSHLPWLIACLGSCTADDAPDISGRHVEVFLDTERSILCAGGIEHFDRYIEQICNHLEISLSPQFNVTLQVTDNPPCPLGACYRPDDRVVYISDFDPLGYIVSGLPRHEITHAVVDHHWGQSTPFLEEGLAETLSNSLLESTKTGPVSPVRDMFGLQARDVDYVLAARFVRFLIDTRGVPRFRRLYSAAYEASREEIILAVETIYLETLDEIEGEFLSRDRCQYQFSTCDIDNAATVFDKWSMEAAASCLHPDFFGSQADEMLTVATQRTIKIQTTGTYRIVFPNYTNVFDRWSSRLTFVRCGNCEEQFISSTGAISTDIYLSEGFYSLQISATDETILDVSLQLNPPKTE